MTHAVDVRRRERSAVRQPPEDPALLHGLEQALPDLNAVIHWLATGCDPTHAVTELRIYQSRIDAAHAALNAYREGKR